MENKLIKKLSLFGATVKQKKKRRKLLEGRRETVKTE